MVIATTSWWNRYWRLRFKCEAQDFAGPNEVERAKLLLRYPPRSGGESYAAGSDPHREAVEWLEEVLLYAHKAWEDELQQRTQEARLGAHSDGRHDDHWGASD